MLDYLIIGQGIAGSCLAWELMHKNILVVDVPSKNKCSSVAAGIINPITGMRLTKTWMAEELFDYAQKFYRNIENQYDTKFWIDRPIIRPANDVEQLNDALARISDGFLGDFIEYEERNSEYEKHINSKHGFFHIKKGGNLLVNQFLDLTRTILKEKKSYLESWINFDEIIKFESHYEWKNVKAKKIVFCTGFYQSTDEPFNYLPFGITRGEMLKISSNKLNNKCLYNKNAFILHSNLNEFIAGASFSHDATLTITEEGKNEMIEKLNDLIKVKYEITDHYYGIRPTVKDRKPFLGEHPTHKNTFIFNGLGTKGVTQGPFFAKKLADLMENDSPIQKDIDIKRCLK
jgi:glycine/D-amino acid oxidase-like deaminating enzyme